MTYSNELSKVKVDIIEKPALARYKALVLLKIPEQVYNTFVESVREKVKYDSTLYRNAPTKLFYEV